LTTLVKLPAKIRTNGSRLRPVINTVQEALKLIDQELPVELKRASRWTFARELLVVAATSGKNETSYTRFAS